MSDSFDAWIKTEAGQRAIEYAESAPGAGLGMAWDAALDGVVAALPDNWCDALLTGTKGINIPAMCPDIEKLIRGIERRVLELRATAQSELHAEGDQQ